MSEGGALLRPSCRYSVAMTGRVNSDQIASRRHAVSDRSYAPYGSLGLPIGTRSARIMGYPS
jgi:hypothetical protein